MKVRILGSGGAMGVPTAAGYWGCCDPQNSKNQRTRMSVALHSDDGETWLIDAGPDLRFQLLREGLTRVDGLFLTHPHFDHIMGLDDLRCFAFKSKKRIPCYADAITLSMLHKSFPYLMAGFDDSLELSPSSKRVILPIQLQESFLWKGQNVRVFHQDHGKIKSVCYHFGSWAYSTDVSALTQEDFSKLKGVKVWFVEALSVEKSNAAHSYLTQTLRWIEAVQPERAILIHMGPHLDYENVKRHLPKGVEPAYDGMIIDVP